MARNNSSGLPQGGGIMKPVRLGAGGFVTGISISTDGATKIVRTDVFNGYVKGAGDKVWRPLFTPSTLPTGEYHGSSGYVFPAGLVDSAALGCYEAVVAPNDATRLYAVCNARLFKSSDTGHNWTRISAVPDFLAQSNSGGQPHNSGPNMAVDPQNKDVFLLGTQRDGLKYSTNGGSTVGSVSIGTNDTVGWVEPSKVACDPTGTVTGGVKQRWFAWQQGTGGYVSTTGPGGPYTLMTGSPTRCSDIDFDPSGNCWVCDPSIAAPNLWKCAAGTTTWTQQTGMPALLVVTVAADPLNAGRVVAMSPNGPAVVTSNGGTTWLGHDIFQTAYPDTAGGTHNLFAYSIPWLGIGHKHGFIPGMARFDPATSNKLWCSEGLGVRHCSAPTAFDSSSNGHFDWVEESEGIEELVANHCMTPPGSDPLFFCWDKPIWKLPINDLDHSPRGYPLCPGGNVLTVQPCWDAAYAADDRNWHAYLINNTGQFSGYSTDGSKTVQTFPVPPPNNGNGGCIAVGNAGNVIIIYSNNGQPVYTKDGGNTWATLPFPNLQPKGSVSGFGNNDFNLTKFITYDALAGAFYLYNYGAGTAAAGVYKSTTQGDSWTKVFAGNVVSTSDLFRGKIRAVPGQVGNLFFCDGAATTGNLKFSTNGAVSWTSVPNVTSVADFGFGAAAPGKSYPSIYFYGNVSGVPGTYRSDDNFATTPKLLATYPNNSLDGVSVCTGDLNKYGRFYVGFSGSGFAYGDYDDSITLT